MEPWKKEFETADELVWLIMFMSIIWLNMIYFPFLVFAAPIFLYLHFKFVKLRLVSWKVPPEDSSNDDTIGYFIMIFLNVTFFLNVATVLFL